jgi:hypothetical protein
METRFNIERLEYGLHISKSGNICLDLIGGTTKQGSANRNPCDDLFWDEPYYGDIDLGINALKVLRKAKRILLGYVFNTKPGRIGFAASTERKVRIYRWMAERMAARLPDYNLVEYPAGKFNFYKQYKPV